MSLTPVHDKFSHPFRKKLVKEVIATRDHPIVREHLMNGDEFLDINARNAYSKILRPRLRKQVEKLQLWDACNGEKWWNRENGAF